MKSSAFKIAFRLIVAKPIRAAMTLVGVILAFGMTVLACCFAATVISIADIALADPPNVGETVERVVTVHFEDDEGRITETEYTETYTVESNSAERGLWRFFMVCFALGASALASLVIYASFAASFDTKTKTVGMLSALGASGPQKAFFVSAEAIIYTAVSLPLGYLLGRVLSEPATLPLRSSVMANGSIPDVGAQLTPGFAVMAVAFSILAVAAACAMPALRAARMTVSDSIKQGEKINISLKKGLLTRTFERLFGRIGLLASQNYYNHRYKYRGMSLSLSACTVTYTAICNFALYASQEARADSITHDGEVYSEVMLSLLFLVISLVTLSLLCSVGSMAVSMNKREGEFALLKSLGMSSSELSGMMMLESVLICAVSAAFSLGLSLAVSAGECAFVGAVTLDARRFEYPFVNYLIAIGFSAILTLIFGIYSSLRIRKTSLADKIKTEY